MTTLVKLLIVCAATPVLAAAQERPGPRPAPTPTPKVSVRPRIDLEFELQMDHLRPKLDEMRLHAEEMRVHALEMAKHEMSKLDLEHIKEQAREMAFTKIDVEGIKAAAEVAARVAVRDFPHVDFPHVEFPHVEFPDVKFELMAPGFSGRDRFLESRPPAPWAQEDPADSLYRLARESLNRGEYRRAAQLFNEVTKKYPRSRYALDCAYWEAFARYRSGSTEDLRAALKILDDQGSQFAALRNHEGNVDVQALRARILGALAARGDNQAEAELRRNAAQTSSCDREDVAVRAEALSALGQMDMAAAMPAVRRVLQRRDECTVELRRRALHLLARQPSNEAVSLILDVAKNDTDSGIRGEAMRWLPRVAGDSAIPQLEELLRNSADEQQQRAAISALGSIDSDRARRAVRTIIERNDASERVRADAIQSLSRERDGRALTNDELNYLRSLYGKLESLRLKEAVLTSVGRIATPENQQFLTTVARTQNENPSLRATAIQRLGRMEGVTSAEIARLYEVADSRSMREQILSALSQRKEPEAIDKIIEIAKRDTDPQIRQRAITYLSRAASNGNERAKKFLQEMWER